MLDGEIETLIKTALTSGLIARGHPEIGVRRSNQPKQTSVPPTSTVYFRYEGRKKYGWPSTIEMYDAATSTQTTVTTQRLFTRFTVAGLAASDATITSGDIASIAADILNHPSAVTAFIAAGCSIYRVTDLPSVWFLDDKTQNRLWSPFEITFLHKDVYTVAGPGIITKEVSNISRL